MIDCKGPQVACELSWNPKEDGKIPRGALKCGDGTEDYIARVFCNGGSIAGIHSFLARSWAYGPVLSVCQGAR